MQLSTWACGVTEVTEVTEVTDDLTGSHCDWVHMEHKQVPETCVIVQLAGFWHLTMKQTNLWLVFGTGVGFECVICPEVTISADQSTNNFFRKLDQKCGWNCVPILVDQACDIFSLHFRSPLSRWAESADTVQPPAVAAQTPCLLFCQLHWALF